jgi:exopolyphosphatase/guanosine-5'-triphosphate,3'-diphosphate pyrophosphatase
MVIFEKTSRFAFHLLHEIKSRVRISENAYQNGGNLQEAALERAIAALRDFLSIAESYRVRKTLCVATSAVRDAPNKQHFLKRARQELGLNIKVIDGRKEAYLGGVACANLLPRSDAMSIDVGGGSTECACLDNGIVTDNHSLDIGTVRIKELYFDKGDIDGAVAFIDAALSALPVSTKEHIIGIGGTFRALAQVLLKQSGQPLKKLHAFTFDAEALKSLGEKIVAAESDGELKSLGVKKERYDVIRPGTLILLRLLEHVGCKRVTTSGVGVREGLYLTDLLRNSSHRFPENFNPSLRYLLDVHNLEARQSNNLAKVSKELFDLLHAKLDIDPAYRYELGIAAKLAKVGASVHFYSYHKNSQRLVQSALEYGYTHEQISLISMLVLYHKGKRPNKQDIKAYGALLPDLKCLTHLSFLLSLADALLAHYPANVDFSFSFSDKELVIHQEKHPFYLAKEQINELSVPKKIKIRFV